MGGSAGVFELDARQLLLRESDVTGSRHASYNEITASPEFVTKGEVFQEISLVWYFAAAEFVDELVEYGEIVRWAAQLISCLSFLGLSKTDSMLVWFYKQSL